ncbi:purine-nucleoside phosphorylase [Psychrosphaera sp. B3R10]|uniref:purine-nucleoside phosphorylase n=1 Tax=unclassified Psychrosphaera TaxID=2641570 RepID=UPI001C0A5B7E|nr:purine-nucleoside phosphorylase [Psychrosphaera sp. I2R16]MBU2988440.1 purine-nucleoside phosphorylase [Psychrosphaera sp. B3R10]
MNKPYLASAEYIKQHIGDFKPKYAIILGSGLADIANDITNPIVIKYQDIPMFPVSSVSGHPGELIAGYLNDVPVLCMKGRFHYYEGLSFDQIAIPIRTLKALGADDLILTNASGSLNSEMTPGSLMIIEDHLNFSGVNPLVGINDPDIGPRFVDLTETYKNEHIKNLRYAGDSLDIDLFNGNYIWVSGPTFETPAEINAYRILGADAVGMSTVPESILARHCGMNVCGVAAITNLAAGLSEHHLSHDETLSQGKIAGQNLRRLLTTFVTL